MSDRYTGPPATFQLEDPRLVEERRKAGQDAYDAAIAAGRSPRAAESARQYASGKRGREQQGIAEAEGEKATQLAIQDRHDRGAWGGRPKPPEHLPPVPVCPCRWCQTEGAHATSCTVHCEESEGACDCGLVETGVAPGPMKADPRKPRAAPAKGAKRRR